MGSTTSLESGASSAEGHHSDRHHRDHHPHHGDAARSNQTTRSHLLSLSKAHNKFALQFYQEAAKDGKKSGNLAYAPLGVSVGLGILYMGSKRVTLQELQETLAVKEVEQSHLLPAFAAMHWDVVRSTVPKGCDFEAAIRLFAPNDCTTLPAYEDLCQNFEISRLKRVDFKNRPDLARKDINQWADDRTRGKIKDVIPPMGIVDRDICILLLSAMYLKMQFLRPFDKKDTENQPFHLILKETLSVPTMHQQNLFQYAHSSKMDCDAIELPCTNTHLKLIILLPRKQEGLKKVEEKLSPNNLDAVLKQMTDETVDVYLPRFHYEAGCLAGEILQKTGLRAIFGQGKADLSGIDGSRDLFLSRVYHYINIEVDEGDPTDNPGPSSLPDGPGPSSAPAGEPSATASGGKPSKVKTFRADHPFLFIVKDDRTGAIVVLGRVVRPSSSPVT